MLVFPVKSRPRGCADVNQAAQPRFILLLKVMMKIFFRYLFVALCIGVFTPSVLRAQSMSKFYVSKSIEDGMLYFILPHKAKLLSGSADKYLSYDFTYLTTQDSVTMLATFKSRYPQRPKTFHLGGSRGEGYPVQAIYTNIRGKWWVSRLSCRIPISVWREAMQAKDALQFHWMLDGGEEVVYGYTGAKWQKRQRKYQVFFDILRLN